MVAAAYIYRQLSGHGGVARRIHPTASSPAPAAPTATFNPKDRIHERLNKLHEEDYRRLQEVEQEIQRLEEGLES